MKVCSRCKIEKAEDQFQRNGSRLRSQCRVCVSEYDSKRQRESPTRKNQWRKYAQRYQEIKREAFIKSGGCVDCRITDLRVLEFDHLPEYEKSFTIAGNRKGIEALKAEIAKCEVVCANCHRIRTAERAATWKSNGD